MLSDLFFSSLLSLYRPLLPVWSCLSLVFHLSVLLLSLSFFFPLRTNKGLDFFWRSIVFIQQKAFNLVSGGGALIFWVLCYHTYFNFIYVSVVLKRKPSTTIFSSEGYVLLLKDIWCSESIVPYALWTKVSFQMCVMMVCLCFHTL